MLWSNTYLIVSQVEVHQIDMNRPWVLLAELQTLEIDFLSLKDCFLMFWKMQGVRPINRNRSNRLLSKDLCDIFVRLFKADSDLAIKFKLVVGWHQDHENSKPLNMILGQCFKQFFAQGYRSLKFFLAKNNFAYFNANLYEVVQVV